MSNRHDVLTQNTSRRSLVFTRALAWQARNAQSLWISAGSAISALIVVLVYTTFASAQQLPTAIPQTKFVSGQDVVPYFEGWIRNPDGTFDLVFGYFNRNWQEELAIPAGPDNL